MKVNKIKIGIGSETVTLELENRGYDRDEITELLQSEGYDTENLCWDFVD